MEIKLCFYFIVSTNKVEDAHITAIITGENRLSLRELEGLYLELLPMDDIDKAKDVKTADVKMKAKRVLTAYRTANPETATVGTILKALRDLGYHLYARNLQAKWIP